MIQNFQDILLSEDQKLDSLYDICLKTGAAGQDASNHYCDPQLLGHIYAAPYAIFEPQYCLLWRDESSPNIRGYCVAALDSLEFQRKLESWWWPQLRAEYRKKREQKHLNTWSSVELDVLEKNIMQPAAPQVPPYFRDYPSHLHINLLPEYQGQGAGKKLMLAQLDLLRQNGSYGVHLGVALQNQAAIGFYRRLGFIALAEDGGSEPKNSCCLGLCLSRF